MDAIIQRIRRSGPIPFDHFMELALYGEAGFYTNARGAGRAGRDFLTSVQVGPLFAFMVARTIDREWRALGEPDPFFVVEAGAGDGTLAKGVLQAQPECRTALRYLLVERSPELCARQRANVELVDVALLLGPHGQDPQGFETELIPESGVGPLCAQSSELPATVVDGVIIANELLDNLAFGVAEFDGSVWHEVRVGLNESGGFAEVLTPIGERDRAVLRETAPTAVAGNRVPLNRSLTDWFVDAARSLRRGAVIAIDYIVSMETILQRSPGWLRTYSEHAHAGDPLTAPGSRDITADVPLEYILSAARSAQLAGGELQTQQVWLESLGIAEIAQRAQQHWDTHAAVGDLGALKARSTASEAALLCAPGGLGGFVVARFVKAGI